MQKYRIGATRDGLITAIDLEAMTGVGIYATWAASVAGPAQDLYKCANVRTLTLGVRTNMGSQAAFRAPGYVEGMFGLESAIDELCEKLGMDPVDFRRKNHSDVDHSSGQNYSSKHLLACYDRSLELIGLGSGAALPVRGSLPSNGPWRRGMGLASQTWGGGGGPPAHALVRINPDGTVEVHCRKCRISARAPRLR